MRFGVADRAPWLLLGCSALALEVIALYFQYGLALEPCVLCIYQRTAVFGIALGGLLGALAPRWRLLRLPAYLLIGGSTVVGLGIALDHVAIQSGASMSCDFMADFPRWAKLDVWFPAVFMPTGSCDEIKWQWLGYGMPQWMVVIFAAYLAAIGYALFGEWRHARR